MAAKEANEYLLGIIEQMPNGKANREIYEEFLGEATDEELDAIAERIDSEDFIWPIFVYNMDEEKIDVDKVMAVGEKEGVQFFQHIIQTDPITGQRYKSPVKYLVIDLPVRRQIQHLIKKMSVSEGRSVDHLAGQATGDTKAAGISLPELTQLDGRQLRDSPIELVKVRGGDAKAMASMEQQIRETGSFSLGPIMDANTKPKAVDTLKSLFLGRNLRPEGLD